jgi:DNA-binding NarL/FixJ family response regulator
MTSDADALRVVVADDHPYYRSGLARSLGAGGLDVVAEASNGEAAIRAVDETAPDVVVMDLNMPGLSGLEATRHLAEHAPATRVLVLSVSA